MERSQLAQVNLEGYIRGSGIICYSNPKHGPSESPTGFPVCSWTGVPGPPAGGPVWAVTSWCLCRTRKVWKSDYCSISLKRNDAWLKGWNPSLIFFFFFHKREHFGRWRCNCQGDFNRLLNRCIWQDFLKVTAFCSTSTHQKLSLDLV